MQSDIHINDLQISLKELLICDSLGILGSIKAGHQAHSLHGNP